MTTDNNVPCVVTTAHHGVFFGYCDPTIPENKTIRLTDAKMCIRWSASIKGVLGLAATGPNENCRIGPAVPAITLTDVTSIMETSTQAEAAWNLNFWA